MLEKFCSIRDPNAWNAITWKRSKNMNSSSTNHQHYLHFSNGFHKYSPFSQAGVTNGTILAITILTEHSGSTISSPQLTVLVLQPRFWNGKIWAKLFLIRGPKFLQSCKLKQLETLWHLPRIERRWGVDTDRDLLNSPMVCPVRGFTENGKDWIFLYSNDDTFSWSLDLW